MTSTDAVAINTALRGSLAAAETQHRLITEIAENLRGAVMPETTTTVPVSWLRDQVASALSELRGVESEFPELRIPLMLSTATLSRGLESFDRAETFVARRGALVGTLSTIRATLGDALQRHPEYRQKSTILWDVEQLALARFTVVEAAPQRQEERT